MPVLGQEDVVVTRAVIFGPHPPSWLPEDAPELEARRVICVPAGVEHAMRHGFTPEAVCGLPGDVPPAIRLQLQEQAVRFLRPYAADAGEALALGLNYAITTGVTDICVLGIVGPDLAGTLTHLFVLSRPEWGGARLQLIHGAERGYLLRHGETAILRGRLGDVVHFIPLSSTVSHLTTQGTDPLYRNEALEYAQTRTARLTVQAARVWIASGRLLVLHHRA